jgi:hypothetical protein
VADVYPELVVNDEEGRPYTVRYDLLNPLLLREVQEQRRSLERQQVEIEDLKAQLTRLETRLEKNPNPEKKDVPFP